MTPEQVAEALAAFGWDVAGDEDFWRRYHSDAWVYNLANAVASLRAERVCKRCGGRGSWWSGGTNEHIHQTCPACGGTGQETP